MTVPDWGLLETFLRVAERGSFTTAAAALRTSQPTLSRRIRRLEEQLGVILFTRQARGLQLTEHGTTLLESVRGISPQIEAVVRRATGIRETPAGDVRVTANEPLGVHVLMPAFARLREAHPQLQIELVIDNRVADLSRREADVAVRMFRPSQADLIVKRIGRISTGLFASTAYLERRGRPERREQLARHTLIGFDRNWPKPLTSQNLRIRDFGFRTDSLLAQIAAARDGVGIAGTHSALGRRYGLEQVLPLLPLQPLEVWLVTHEELRASAGIRTVFVAIERALRAYVDRDTGVPD